MEIYKAQNKETNKVTYFKVINNKSIRISKNEYDALFYSALVKSAMYTVSNKTHYKHYTNLR